MRHGVEIGMAMRHDTGGLIAVLSRRRNELGVVKIHPPRSEKEMTRDVLGTGPRDPCALPLSESRETCPNGKVWTYRRMVFYVRPAVDLNTVRRGESSAAGPIFACTTRN